jgi:penicillin-binding protein 1A
MTIKRVVIGVGALITILFLAGLTWVMIIAMGLPSAKDLANYEPPITSRVHAGDGKLVAEFANQKRVYVPSDELPDQLIQAFISAEDKSFFEHSGVDWWGVIRGTLGNAVRGKRMAGGSTITQQVVKNMLVGSERSLTRKARELILAGRIEKQFTKHQILELYMNEIYLGGSSYGVGAAALNYFGKSLAELSLAQCALLAAEAQLPARVNPYNHPEAAIERRNWVLDRMAVNGYIKKDDAEKAKAEPLKTVARLDTDENQAAAYYVEELRRDILKLGEDKKLAGFETKKDATKAFYEGGLSIRSTLDSQMQLIAQTALRAGLETYDREHGFRGPVGNLKSSDKFEEDLAAFVKTDAGKAAVAGIGNSWQLAVVRSVSGGTVKLGLQDGETATLAADDVKWTSGYKREGKGANGLRVDDLILVSREPVPDNHAQLITEYDGPAHRPRLRDGGRLFVPEEPVQPRGAVDAPAGLVVQAVRLCGRAGAAGRVGRLQVDALEPRARCALRVVRSAPGCLLQAVELRGELFWSRDAALRRRALAQHHDGAPRQGHGPRESVRDGRADGHLQQAAAV